MAVDKPAGIHVHPPEDQKHRIAPSTNGLKILAEQLGLHLYPVHRLDRATSGVLLYALTAAAAGELARQFREREVLKHYVCVARGWTDEAGVIDHALAPEAPEGEATRERKESLPSVTRYRTVARCEVPYPDREHPRSRYSLLIAEPETGRRHQLRRHFSHLAHPLIGDPIYGHGPHNRLFRDGLKLPGLLLKAQSIALTHPSSGERLEIHSRWTGVWHRVFDLFGACPRLGRTPRRSQEALKP